MPDVDDEINGLCARISLIVRQRDRVRLTLPPLTSAVYDLHCFARNREVVIEKDLELKKLVDNLISAHNALRYELEGKQECIQIPNMPKP